MTKALAILGTGSDVGKSLFATALGRLAWRRGLRVAPFKAQNMSLNSFVTTDGGEIGRAQALQAWACGLIPTVDMNPILLKPESDTRSQVILQGRVCHSIEAAVYYQDQTALWAAITDSYARIGEKTDLVIIEGAGSAAEINLMERDLVNWRMVEHADAEVILVADIDRGGVFAQVIGTLELLPAGYRRRTIGIVINKFRGDASLFYDGRAFIEARTGIPVLGVVPFLRDHGLDQEDSLDHTAVTSRAFSSSTVNIAIVLLPRLSNFTDFNTLALEPDVAVRWVDSPEQLANADVLILPGTKNTLADVRYLHGRGWSARLAAHVHTGGELIGICGGYQMLGHRIADPDGLEDGGAATGFGWLDVTTELKAPKICRQVRGRVTQLSRLEGSPIEGYEIHMGRMNRGTMGPCFEIWAATGHTAPPGAAEGTVTPDGRVWGTSVHGLFDNATFRQRWLNRLRARKGLPLTNEASFPSTMTLREIALDRWADHVAAHVQLSSLFPATPATGRAAHVTERSDS